MIIKDYRGKSPKLSGAYLAEDVTIVGDVTVEKNASIWYGAVLRGDNEPIIIGENTSIQDNSVVHCDAQYPVIIGKNCVVGHNAILHSCVVEDGCLIGMGAILLNGCRIGAGSIVAAGAVVSSNKEIPPGSMVMGIPGKVTRQLTEDDIAATAASVDHYIHFAAEELIKRD